MFNEQCQLRVNINVRDVLIAGRYIGPNKSAITLQDATSTNYNGVQLVRRVPINWRIVSKCKVSRRSELQVLSAPIYSRYRRSGNGKFARDRLLSLVAHNHAITFASL